MLFVCFASQRRSRRVTEEMLEVISHMTNEDPLKRPGIVEVVNFLKGRALGVRKTWQDTLLLGDGGLQCMSW